MRDIVYRPIPVYYYSIIADKLEWFYWFDKDNNDQLDEGELRKVFQALCWDPTDEEFKELMKKCDLDG